MTALLTQEQLNQIANTFGLQAKETFKVRDGIVAIDDKVWWRSSDGPEHVTVRGSLRSIKASPDLYQIACPVATVVYED